MSDALDRKYELGEERKMSKDDKELTVHDIECKIQERMELLEKSGKSERLAELGLLMDWVLCGDDY